METVGNRAVTPLFSLITVTYQAERTLLRTLESVSRQTCRDFEQLIVDGASTDGTAEIARRFAELPGFRWFSEPDRGLYDAMNKGIERARGRYLIFLNAGDAFHDPLALERLAEEVRRGNEPDIVYGETALVDDEGRFLGMRRLKAPKRLTWKSFRTGMRVSHQAFVAQRSLAEPYDLQYRFSADFDWCIRLMRKASSIRNSGTVLIDYLNEGMTTRNHKASLRERFRIMVRYYGLLPVTLLHGWFAVRYYVAKWALGRV